MAAADPVHFRHDLHRHPELSGRESDTAWRVRAFFRPLRPDDVIEQLGGTGIAFVFEGAAPGPTVMFRCELDAVPVAEPPGAQWRSVNEGVSHACGHDGHMAILAELGSRLAAKRPARGRAVLLFQPAEESGLGARAVLADARFARIQPAFAFALHNLPGYPLGQVLLREGSFSCASRGVSIRLEGTQAHAAQPETGRSPAAAMCRIVQELDRMPDDLQQPGELAFATIVGARLGARSFGVAAGRAEVWATLRSETDATMERIVTHVESMARAQAEPDRLGVHFEYEDVYPAVVNDARALDLVRRAAGDAGTVEMDRPFRWSEDFGHITATTTGALFGIGAGTDLPHLHNEDYAFPDALIPLAADVFSRLLALCADP